MPNIFISYRRDDSAAVSGRLYDYLENEFGKNRVFKDVDNIPQGEEFRTVVFNAIQESDVVLVIIGKTWLSIKDSRGYRRIDEPQDLVRQEIIHALKRPETLVIPVLVDGASMPSTDNLPEDIREISSTNAAIVRNDPDFRHDMSKLVKTLQKLDESEQIVKERERKAAQQATKRVIRIVIVISLVMVIILTGLFVNGTIKIPGFATATIDPFQEAFHLLTNTAEAEIASHASSTPDITRTIQFILNDFVIQTQVAYQGQTAIALIATQSTLTLSATQSPSETSTPSVTPTQTILPTLTPNETLTAEIIATSVGATAFAKATNDSLATQQAPTNTSVPSDTPTATDTSTVTATSTDTATYTATASSTITSTPAPTSTSTPNQATQTAISAGQATAAIQAAKATLTRQASDMTATATQWTLTPSYTPRPTSTPVPPTPYLGVLLQFDFTKPPSVQNNDSDWHIVSENGNNLYCIDNTSSTTYPSFNFANTNWRNYSIEINVRFAPTTGTHAVTTILTRLNNQGWGYRHGIFESGVSQYYFGGANASPSTIVDLGSNNFSIQFNTWHLMRAEVDENEIRTYLDGKLIASTKDDKSTQGKAGIEVFPQTNACIDNLFVRSLDRSSDSLNAALLGHVLGDGTQIRLGPSIQEPSIGSLNKGQEVFVLDSDSESKWLLIYNDVTKIQGWISRDLLK